MKNFIIKNLCENEYLFIISDGLKDYEVKKADLGGVVLHVNDEVTLTTLSSFPRVIAALELNGKKIFHKSRKEVIEEYLQNEKDRLLYKRLPLIAKERIKMFSMLAEGFTNYDRLYEILTLTLGYNLFRHYRNEKDIKSFTGLPISEQVTILPRYWHPLMPQIPGDLIIRYALAFLRDDTEDIRGIDREDLLDSAVMELPNATSLLKQQKSLCEPRFEYIVQYLTASA